MFLVWNKKVETAKIWERESNISEIKAWDKLVFDWGKTIEYKYPFTWQYQKLWGDSSVYVDTTNQSVRMDWSWSYSTLTVWEKIDMNKDFEVEIDFQCSKTSRWWHWVGLVSWTYQNVVIRGVWTARDHNPTSMWYKDRVYVIDIGYELFANWFNIIKLKKVGNTYSIFVPKNNFSFSYSYDYWYWDVYIWWFIYNDSLLIRSAKIKYL